MHGLSTAWHLAERGEEVLVVDKTGVAAGASGIACGVVRNNYFQPAMSELMAACVEIWESDPETFHYHGSGYIALGDGDQEADLTTVAERQERIGYESELILGEDRGREAHEARSSPTGARPACPSACTSTAAASRSTRSRSTASRRRRSTPAPRSPRAIEVTGFELDDSGAVTRVNTSDGPTSIVEQVIVAVGPWIAKHVGTAGAAAAPGGRAARTARCGPTGTSRRARSTSTRASS